MRVMTKLVVSYTFDRHYLCIDDRILPVFVFDFTSERPYIRVLGNTVRVHAYESLATKAFVRKQREQLSMFDVNYRFWQISSNHYTERYTFKDITNG